MSLEAREDDRPLARCAPHPPGGGRERARRGGDDTGSPPQREAPSKMRAPPPHTLEADILAEKELEERLLLQADLKTRVSELEEAVERESDELRRSQGDLVSVERATDELLVSASVVERDVDAARVALDRSRMALVEMRDRKAEMEHARESVESSSAFLLSIAEDTVPNLARSLRDLEVRHDGQAAHVAPNSWNSVTRSLAALDASIGGLSTSRGGGPAALPLFDDARVLPPRTAPALAPEAPAPSVAQRSQVHVSRRGSITINP